MSQHDARNGMQMSQIEQKKEKSFQPRGGKRDQQESQQEFDQERNEKEMIGNYNDRCQLIFENIKVQRVRKYKGFIRIDTYDCISNQPKVGDIWSNLSSFSSELSSELKVAFEGLKEKLPEFLMKSTGTIESEEQHLLSFCQGLGESKELFWFIPARQNGLKLASIILTNELLRELGYDPNNEEEIMEIQNFKLFAFDLLNQRTYDIGFAFYNIRLYDYIQKFLLNDKKALQNFNKKEITSINEFRGKKEVKASISISAISPFIISYRILHTLEIRRLDEDPIVLAKRYKMIQKRRKKSERIIKIYEQNERSKKPIVCGYIKIEKRGKRISQKQKDSDYYQPTEKRGRK